MEEFITFDIAKKLKEKGFDEPTMTYYKDGEIGWSDGFCHFNITGRLSAPTISQVLKWLREEKKIYVSILLFMFKEGWCYEIVQIGKNPQHIATQYNSCDTYEKAAIEGIEYVIDNLI